MQKSGEQYCRYQHNVKLSRPVQALFFLFLFSFCFLLCHGLLLLSKPINNGCRASRAIRCLRKCHILRIKYGIIPYNGCIFSLFVILIPFIYFFGYFIAALCLPLFYELVEI